jgi:competence protein ComEC
MWPACAGLLAWMAGLPTAWLAIVARTGAALPGSGLVWPTGVRGLLLLTAATAAVATAVWTGARRRRRAILGRCLV